MHCNDVLNMSMNGYYRNTKETFLSILETWESEQKEGSVQSTFGFEDDIKAILPTQIGPIPIKGKPKMDASFLLNWAKGKTKSTSEIEFRQFFETTFESSLEPEVRFAMIDAWTKCVNKKYGEDLDIGHVLKPLPNDKLGIEITIKRKHSANGLPVDCALLSWSGIGGENHNVEIDEHNLAELTNLIGNENTYEEVILLTLTDHDEGANIEFKFRTESTGSTFDRNIYIPPAWNGWNSRKCMTNPMNLLIPYVSGDDPGHNFRYNGEFEVWFESKCIMAKASFEMGSMRGDTGDCVLYNLGRWKKFDDVKFVTIDGKLRDSLSSGGGSNPTVAKHWNPKGRYVTQWAYRGNQGGSQKEYSVAIDVKEISFTVHY